MRLSLLLLLFPLILSSQQVINAEEFFTIGLSKHKEYFRSHRAEVSFPWIEDYDFRTETRDFELDKQEYTFRVSPSTAKKRKAQQELYEHYRNAPDFKSLEAYCDRLITIHKEWLSLYILNQAIDTYEELEKILEDKQIVFERMAGTYDFDLDKLVKILTDISDLSIAKNELLLEKDFITRQYGISGREIDFGDFITVQSLEAKIMNRQNALNIPVDLESVFDQEEITKELALEMAESKQYFDFAQLRYEGPHSDLLRERLHLGLAFRIPNSGNRKLRIQELQIEKEQVQREAAINHALKLEDLGQMGQKIMMDIRALTYYQTVMDEERLNLSILANRISSEEGFSPLILLNIEERYILNRMKELEMKEDIFRDYLDYLEESGLICVGSSTNYLTQ